MSRVAATGVAARHRHATALAVLAVAALAGCSLETRYRVLSAAFDGVPPPGTPARERPGRRRAAAAPALSLPPQLTPTVPLSPESLGPETYAEVLETFPKDVMGNVDWVAAVRTGLIAPRPGLEPDAQAAPQLPFDVLLDPGIPHFEVVFPHEAHTFWLKCENCHPAIFQMRAGAAAITMEKIFAGEYCGRCHGKVAFPPQTGCLRCHSKLGRASG